MNGNEPLQGSPTTDYRLRPPQAADAAPIRDLVRRVFINPTGLNWRRFTIAETAAGQMAGFIQLKPHRGGSFELASLAVEEAHRGRGVARLLIEHLLANSPRPLYLTCRAQLAPMYAKFGFRVVQTGRLPCYFALVRLAFKLMALFWPTENGGCIMRLDE